MLGVLWVAFILSLLVLPVSMFVGLGFGFTGQDKKMGGWLVVFIVAFFVLAGSVTGLIWWYVAAGYGLVVLLVVGVLLLLALVGLVNNGAFKGLGRATKRFFTKLLSWVTYAKM